LSKRHAISRSPIRTWAGKFEAGALDDDVQAADLIQEYEARNAAIDRAIQAWSFASSIGMSMSPLRGHCRRAKLCHAAR
jgi:hypothetical protein